MTRLRSASVEDTRAIGAAVASILRAGDVVTLSGDLGAGKTAFVQGAARALGVATPVTSPSFVLVREYPGIAHADVYRLNDLQELFDLGYDDLFAPDRIVFVEWGDAVAGALPADRLEIRIDHEDAETRCLAVEACGARWAGRASDLEQALTPWRTAT